MSKKDTLAGFFTPKVLTASERNDLVAILLNLRKTVFNTAQKTIYKKDLAELPTIYTSPLIQAGNAQPDQTAAQVLEAVIAELKNLPTAELTLPYRPTNQQTKELLQFLRAKLPNQLILKLNYEPQVVAGFMLEYNGQRINYTLDNLLTKLNNNNKANKN